MRIFKTPFIITLFSVLILSGCTQIKKITQKKSSPKTEKVSESKIRLFARASKIQTDTIIKDTFSLIEPSIDSLSEVNQLFDTLAFAQSFKNPFGKNNSIEEDITLLNGSAVVHQLDSLAKLNFYDRHHFETDTAILNVYRFAPGEKPAYSDSVYALRIGILDSQTPIDLEYNEHVKGYIKLYADRASKQTARMLGLAEVYFPLFEEVLDKYNIPLELKYLAVVESALNPTAGSRAGAKGLWQFMYGTGKLYGLDQNSMVDDRFDPYKATEAAGRHLLDLYAIYGDWNLVLAAYNSGPGNVNRAIKRAGGLKNYWAIWPYLPRETRGYVPAFIAVNYVFNYAAEHNIYPVDPGILYHQIDSVSVRDVLSFDQIAEYMNIPIEQIEFLNPAYKVGIIPSLNEKNYVLRLPRKYMSYFIEHEDSLYAFKSEKGMEHQYLMSKIKEAKQRTVHIVRKGENLGSIAHKYNTSVARLQSWNGLRNSQIFPGQKLIVYSPGISAPLSKSSVQSSAETKSYHQVQQGENLGAIAKKYGVTIENLRKWNNMNDSLIHPGQKLQLKPNQEEENSSVQKTETKTAETKTGFHTVKNGDTLWDIAKKYKTSVDRLKSLNHLGSSSKLKLGQKLKIPLSS